MTDMTQNQFNKFAAGLLILRFITGLFLINFLPFLSIDDYYRTHYALWWWNHPGFTSSYVWLPGHHYLYGLLTGLTGDTFWAPRLTSLFLHLGSAVLINFVTGISLKQKLFLMLWILFTPLFFVLGTVPLAETGTMFFILLNIVFTLRFLKSGRAFELLGASAALMAANMFRYEAWFLIPVFIFYVRAKHPRDVSRWVQWVIVSVPAIFPVIWTLFCWASQGEPFRFVFATGRDSFGADNSQNSIWTLMGLTVAAELAAVLSAQIIDIKKNGISAAVKNIWTGYLITGVLFIGLLAWVTAFPTQYKLRIFYLVILFGGFGVSKWFAEQSWSNLKLRFASAAAVIVAALGLYAAFTTPMGIQKDNYETAMWIKRQYDSGELKKNEHTLISHFLPDCAALLIISNHVDSVHLDAQGNKCGVQFLLPFKPTCPLPEWGKDVQMVVARKTSMEEEYVQFLKWNKIKEFDNWSVFKRPAGSVFPVERRQDAPGIFLR
jgi:hypothetical protein